LQTISAFDIEYCECHLKIKINVSGRHWTSPKPHRSNPVKHTAPVMMTILSYHSML